MQDDECISVLTLTLEVCTKELGTIYMINNKLRYIQWISPTPILVIVIDKLTCHYLPFLVISGPGSQFS